MSTHERFHCNYAYQFKYGNFDAEINVRNTSEVFGLYKPKQDNAESLEHIMKTLNMKSM